MIKPRAYDKMWQKFEKKVYDTVKKGLKDKFIVKWQYKINNSKPDVVVLFECNSCDNTIRSDSCRYPVFIFDAYCKFTIDDQFFKKKDRQMKKYSKICTSVLVMPKGFEEWPYCMDEDEKYHIISFHYLSLLTDIILKETIIRIREDACGYVQWCDISNVFKVFELHIRKKIDRCPNCKGVGIPIALIYCSKYDEHYYPDFLDSDATKHGPIPTYVECEGCGDRNLFGWNYDDCPYSEIIHVYQCEKCGAIFDPDSEKIITNFEPSHMDWLAMSFSYYSEI